MANLVRVLLLVACVPLLLPNGFCVCKASGLDRPAPSCTTDASPNKTGCCSHRHCPDEADRSATHPGQPNPHPAPDDDSHRPGCPASPGVDRFKWIEPTHSISLLLPPVEVVALVPLPLVGISPAQTDTPTRQPIAPPLYLSHCSFVI